MTATFKELREHPLIFPVYLPWLLFSLSMGMLIPIMPLYAASFEISYGVIGIVLAGDAIGRLIADLPAGMLLRRWGNRYMIVFGLLLTAFSTAALFWLGSIWLVLVLRLLSGFGRSSYGLAQHAYVAREIPVQQRGRSLALYGGIIRIGAFIGPITGGILAGAFGLRFPLLLAGMLCGIAALIVWFVMPDRSDYAQDMRTIQPGAMWQTARTHYAIFTAAGTAQLFGQLIRAGREVILPLYAADIIGLDVQQIGEIVGLAGLVDMLLFPVAGWLMDRLGRKYATVPTFLLQGIGVEMIVFVGDYFGLLLAAVIASIGNGLSAGTMMTLGSDLAPPDARGEFLGVWRLVGDMGFMAGPLLIGAIADMLLLGSAVWVIAGTGWAASLIFAFFVPETLKRKRKNT